MINSPIFIILISFLLTWIIEYLIILSFLKENKLKILLCSLLINLFTWPLAQLFASYTNILIIEVSVFFIESIFLKYLFNLKLSKAILISFVANLASFLLGIVISMFIG